MKGNLSLYHMIEELLDQMELLVLLKAANKIEEDRMWASAEGPVER